MLIEAPSYHAHIYFHDEDADAAARLHARAGRDLASRATMWPMRMRPVGPHPLPMFEIAFARAEREAVVAWLQAHHGTFSVLLHPETGNDLEDHRDHPVWLGQSLPLNLSIF